MSQENSDTQSENVQRADGFGIIARGYTSQKPQTPKPPVKPIGQAAQDPKNQKQ